MKKKSHQTSNQLFQDRIEQKEDPEEQSSLNVKYID